MDLLREMVAAIGKNKTKSISIISHQQVDRNSKLGQFYEGIVSGDIMTDDDAFERLYPGENSRNSYYKLKNQFKNRLLNTVFFIDAKQEKWGRYGAIVVENNRLLRAATLLAYIGARKAAIQILGKVLVTSRKYELSSDFLRAAQTIVTGASIDGDYKTVKQLGDEAIAVARRHQKEVMATMYFKRIGAKYALSHGVKPEVAEEIDAYLKEIDALPGELSSAGFITTYAMLKMSRAMSTHDFTEAADVATQVLSTLKEYPFTIKKGMYLISVNLFACYLALKDFQNGENISVELLTYTQAGRTDWFKVQELRFLLATATKNYEVAERIYRTATEHPNFRKAVRPYVREAWNLNSAYLHILRLVGRLAEPREENLKFRLQRYLNSVPTFSKDKRGNNVPILISQFILLLATGQDDRLIDREEALSKYKDRYLDKSNNYRANVFVRMILQVTKADFDPVKLQPTTDKYLPLFEEVPYNAMDQHYDQEIIPFEDLWEITLEVLTQRLAARAGKVAAAGGVS